jgi:hypothetical protein
MDGGRFISSINCSNMALLPAVKKHAVQARILYLCLLGVGLMGCGPNVVFESPQPTGGNNLTQYPKDLQGQYAEGDDPEEWMRVEAKKVAIREKKEYRFAQSDFLAQKRFEQVAEQVRDNTYNLSYPFTISGDTLRFSVYEIKNEFGLSDSVVLRRLNKQYCLSYQNQTTKLWQVMVIAPASQYVDIWVIDDQQLTQLQALGKVTPKYETEPAVSDTAPQVDHYLASLTDAAWAKLATQLTGEPTFRFPRQK